MKGSEVGNLTLYTAQTIAWLAPHFGVKSVPPAAVSRNASVVKDYQDDPMNYHGKISARTGVTLINQADQVPTFMDKIFFPFLVLQGTADTLVNPLGAKFLFENAKSEDKDYKEYQGLYHELLNEDESDTIIKDILDWMEKHLNNSI